jgi:hypothetical protein
MVAGEISTKYNNNKLRIQIRTDRDPKTDAIFLETLESNSRFSTATRDFQQKLETLNNVSRLSTVSRDSQQYLETLNSNSRLLTVSRGSQH